MDERVDPGRQGGEFRLRLSRRDAARGERVVDCLRAGGDEGVSQPLHRLALGDRELRGRLTCPLRRDQLGGRDADVRRGRLDERLLAHAGRLSAAVRGRG